MFSVNGRGSNRRSDDNKTGIRQALSARGFDAEWGYLNKINVGLTNVYRWKDDF